MPFASAVGCSACSALSTVALHVDDGRPPGARCPDISLFISSRSSISFACICALRWMTAMALAGSRTRLAAGEDAQPAEDGVDRRSQLVAQGREELVLEPALALCFVARFAFAHEQPLALLLRPALGAHVAAHADDLLDRAVRAPQHLPALGDPHHRPGRAARRGTRTRRVPARAAVDDGGLDTRLVLGMHRARDAQLRPERSGREAEQRSPGPCDHVIRSAFDVPLPGGHLRDVHREPQAFLVLADAPVRHGQRRGALGDAQLELLVGLCERLLRAMPLDDLVLQRLR